MQTTNLWNLYHLSSKKVILSLLFLVVGTTLASAQEHIRRHDNKKAQNGYSYGIHIGMTQHNFRLERSSHFLDQEDIQAIEGNNEPGVSIGIIGVLHPSERVELRAIPSMA